MSGFERRSWAVTTAVLVPAGASLTMTAWYLQTDFSFLAINFTIAAVVVIAPLLTVWPITTKRALMVAAIWAAAGSMPGAYIFGVFVFLGALVTTATVLVIHAAQLSLAGQGRCPWGSTHSRT